MAGNEAFLVAIQAFIDKAQANQEQIIRSVGIRILTRLVQKSPVDTGRFRGNWLVGFENQPAGVHAEIDPGGAATIERGLLMIEQFKVGTNAVYFTNNLPYAYPLEMGHSKQAPGGMVRITAAEFQQFFQAAAQEIKQ